MRDHIIWDPVVVHMGWGYRAVQPLLAEAVFEDLKDGGVVVWRPKTDGEKQQLRP